MKKKGLALVLALTLLVVCVVAGTLAWLTAKSDTVVNTFTTSDVSITLTEEAGGTSKEFKMVPGCTITKDPKVTVKAGSEKCYLFVKIAESDNFSSFMTYTVAAGWTPLNDTNNDGVADDGVYYRVVDTTEMGTPYSVLADDQVTVKGSVTKEQMNALDAEGAVKPTLTITAYASQLHRNATDTFSASEAWSNIANK